MQNRLIMTRKRKYIFITGGVISSLGKGLTSAAIALLLEGKGLKVSMLKLDPYLNVDPGTMNPLQHGEVYVTDDGAETDLDLGHYYRYTNAKITKASNVTAGQIYEGVIKKERRGTYLGKTVQVIPHVTDEIKQKIIDSCEQDSDIAIIEIGGTVGDIESQPFLEAIRQFQNQHATLCITIHLTYVPYLSAAKEIKTKPTQHSVQLLRSIGIIPDLIICRTESPLSQEIKEKIALFCSVPNSMVIEAVDVDNIYEVPIKLQKEGLDEKITHLLELPSQKSNLEKWENLLLTIKNPKYKASVGMVGKYIHHQDAYKSVVEALQHAAIICKVDLEIIGIDAELISSIDEIPPCHGYLIPGGFGVRGWEGKIFTAQYCRQNHLPYFGICLGMQVMIVEFARNILELTKADSTEMNQETPFPVISLLSEQVEMANLGGSMRLGAYPCNLLPKTKAKQIYNCSQISERHRHRYEFNNYYRSLYEKNQFIVSGIYEKENLCEIVELLTHPWMIGVQFHPEFKSKPIAAHPLFISFITAIKMQNTI